MALFQACCFHSYSNRLSGQRKVLAADSVVDLDDAVYAVALMEEELTLKGMGNQHGVETCRVAQVMASHCPLWEACCSVRAVEARHGESKELQEVLFHFLDWGYSCSLRGKVLTSLAGCRLLERQALN